MLISLLNTLCAIAAHFTYYYLIFATILIITLLRCFLLLKFFPKAFQSKIRQNDLIWIIPAYSFIFGELTLAEFYLFYHFELNKLIFECLILCLILIVFYFSKWFINSKPWIRVVTDILTVPLLYLLAAWFPKVPHIITTFLIITLIGLRYTIIVSLHNKKFSFTLNDNYYIFSEIFSFLAFLSILVNFDYSLHLSLNFVGKIIAILFYPLLYIILLYINPLLYKQFAIPKEELSFYLVTGLSYFLAVISISAVLLYSNDDDALELLMWAVPAISSTFLQGIFSVQEFRLKRAISPSRKFKFMVYSFNTALFLTIFLLNFFIKWGEHNDIPFIDVHYPYQFNDYRDMVAFSSLLGVGASFAITEPLSKFFANPKRGYIVLKSKEHKFPKRIHKKR